MKLEHVKKITGIFIRVFIIAFVFIMDVKVKAEMHSNLPLDHKINLDSNTLTSQRSDGSLDFFYGKGFFIVRQNSSPIMVHTPQGIVSSSGSEFTLEVEDGKTTLSVLSGEASLSDRASNKELKIQGGYSFWLGGLMASGVHASPLAVEAYDYDHVMAIVKNLSDWSEKEFDSHSSDFRPIWKEAVVKVAEDTQYSINKDIQIINAMILAEEKRDNQKRLDQSKIHKLFREKALGESYGNTERPLELPRTPASVSVKEDTEHN